MWKIPKRLARLAEFPTTIRFGNATHARFLSSHTSIKPNDMEQVVIIGGGPAGLTAAIYCARAGLNPLLASGNVPGGQLMITSEVENFPGFLSISGPDLISQMIQQAKECGTRILPRMATDFNFELNPNADSSASHKLVIDGQTISTRSIILANGASARWLGLEREEALINNGISACATCDGPLFMFRNQTLFVVGGGDSACEEALFLTKFASRVFMVHRRDRLRASKIMAERVLSHEKITMLWDSEVESYIGEDLLQGVVVRNVISGETRSYECKGLFMAIGHDPNTKTLENTALKLDESKYIVVRDNVYTNIPGVFAAGDCHDKIYRQAISAAGFGCQAALACERYLSH